MKKLILALLILSFSSIFFAGCGYDDYPPYYSYQNYYASEYSLGYYYSDYEYDWNYYTEYDYDWDGVPDYYDYCPYRAGDAYNYGCPYTKYYMTCTNCCSWLRGNKARYYYYWSWYYLPDSCYW
ncbi:MAG: hypothetical protein ABIA04_12975 [Pseudomonadota bacterium]